MVALDDDDPIPIGDLFKAVPKSEKYKTLDCVDHVFHGGLPQRGNVFLPAPAGSGKTSLILKIFQGIANQHKQTCLYISDEQNETDIVDQFRRIGDFDSKYMFIKSLKDKDDIIACIEKSKAQFIAVDSITRIENITDAEGYPLSPGHPAAMNQVAVEFKRLTSDLNKFMFVTGHVTDDNTIKGGTGVRHMFDATLCIRYMNDGKFEKPSDDPRRIMFFEGKSRFCAVGRTGMFELVDEGGIVDHGPYIKEVNVDNALATLKDYISKNGIRTP